VPLSDEGGGGARGRGVEGEEEAAATAAPAHRGFAFVQFADGPVWFFLFASFQFCSDCLIVDCFKSWKTSLGFRV